MLDNVMVQQVLSVVNDITGTTGRRFTDRAVSGFGLSIGTGLALETMLTPTEPVYDAKRQHPGMIQLDQYKLVVFNIHTLARNIISAIPKPDYGVRSSRHLIDILMSEVVIIMSLLADTKTVPVFTFKDYSADVKRYNLDKSDNIRKPYSDMLTIANSIKDVTRRVELWKQPKTHPNALILTHMVNDLHDYSKSAKLTLLESHTGKIKTSVDFIKKVSKKPEHQHIPLTPLTQYILGDQVVSKPMSSKYKRILLELSLAKRWTQNTTHVKIKHDITHSSELGPIVKNFVKG